MFDESNFDLSASKVVTILLVLLYIYYVKRCKRFRVYAQNKVRGSKDEGKSLPKYANGWFVVTRSEKLAPGQVIQFHGQGQNIAIFRGHDRIVYAIGAYCGHLSANLAVGGTIINDSCIRCPFHGWLYDGRTGTCVNADGSAKKVKQFYYQTDQAGCVHGPFQRQEGTKITKNKKYLIAEIGRIIYIWLHVENQAPSYYPFDYLPDKFQYRGKTVNVVSARIQDLPQNGCDFAHFRYVHTNVSQWSSKLVSLRWEATWKPASQYTPEGPPFAYGFRKQVSQSFLKGQDLTKIGVLNLTSYANILGWQFKTFSLIIFQVGPGIVHMFMKSPLCQFRFLQFLKVSGTDQLTIEHQLFGEKWTPYWLSVMLLYIEFTQVFNDGQIWSNKKMHGQFKMNPISQQDKKFLEWKTWFCQFYKGIKKPQSASW